MCDLRYVLLNANFDLGLTGDMQVTFLLIVICFVLGISYLHVAFLRFRCTIRSKRGGVNFRPPRLVLGCNSLLFAISCC